MLIRRCATVYIEQMIDHVEDRAMTQRGFKQSLEAFKRSLQHEVVVLHRKEGWITVRSKVSGNNLEVSIGQKKKGAKSWTLVYQLVREQLKVPRSASMLLWFENKDSLYTPDDCIVARSDRYITEKEAKRTLVYIIKGNNQVVHRTCCDPQWVGWFCRICNHQH